MRFAFSTACCPQWNLDLIAAKGKEYGYDGIEIRAAANDTTPTATNVLTDPGKVRALFAGRQIEIACLSSSFTMTGHKERDQQLAEQVRGSIDTAQALGCPLVKVLDMQVRPGRNRAAAAVALGQWLLPLGDYAAQRGITIVVQNALSFRAAREMWMIFEQMNHPFVACCWDVFSAALIGEPPAISVPVLNSRIQYAKVVDAKLGPQGATLCKLGEGDVPVRDFLTRLRGIGYAGWVSVERDTTWPGALSDPHEILHDAITKLRQWSKPQTDERPRKTTHAAAVQ